MTCETETEAAALPVAEGEAAATTTTTEPGGKHAERIPVATMRHLQMSGWYWGSLTATQARQQLMSAAEGTFLVRDSAHPDFLLTLSVQTSRGPTNVRIEHRGGAFSLDSVRFVKPHLVHFDDVVKLVQFYVGCKQQQQQQRHLQQQQQDLSEERQQQQQHQQNHHDHHDHHQQQQQLQQNHHQRQQKEENGWHLSRCLWEEGAEVEEPLPLRLCKPCYVAPPSLQHQCRTAMHRARQRLPGSIRLPKRIRSYLEEYPFHL
ncbi:suppressor of cytokine signaling 2-like [Lethenteron reissneri]|uniref:suppressor of cytokine signaling 2-like n=1 Tax=Lethenteron reissneri TaxID=7753 RepID=UPI002AB6D1F6|nr:suppressor of cytokine signaling 2-like [Lethenteron reissneri]XP_061418779.1 suppressor of cytokine signaling 2-like [Lethenteron reissneri]